jgi:selenocysteine-specific elongation factor
LGGGRVLDPHPGRRHRRFRPDVVERLQTLSQGTPGELLLQKLQRLEPITQSNLLKQAGMDADTAVSTLQELENEQKIIRLDQQILSRAGWQRNLNRMTDILTAYHRELPLRLGIPREELRSRLKLPAVVFNPLVSQAAADGLLVEVGAVIQAPAHEIRFTPQQQTAVDQLLQQMNRAGISSPSVKECKAAVGDAVYGGLVDLGTLRPLNDDVVFAQAEYERFTKVIVNYLRQNGRINAAQVRDLLQTSRKYAIALLEHLDHIKLTRRVGDDRILKDEDRGQKAE